MKYTPPLTNIDEELAKIPGEFLTVKDVMILFKVGRNLLTDWYAKAPVKLQKTMLPGTTRKGIRFSKANIRKFVQKNF